MTVGEKVPRAHGLGIAECAEVPFFIQGYATKARGR